MSEIIIQTEKNIFDTEALQRGGFLIAKSKSWDAPRNCLVVKVGEEEIKALFLTGVNSAVSYLKISAAEVVKGDYELMYSNDLTEVYGEINL